MMELPILQIPSFEHLSDDVQKLRIIYFLLQQLHKYFMVYVVEEPFDIKLNEPFSPGPFVLDIL